MLAYNKHLEAEMEVVASFKRKDGIHFVYRDALQPFAKMLLKRIKQDRQNVVVVTGETGSGKSTFAIQLCYAMGGKSWSLRDNYIYDVTDLQRKLDDPDASPISLFDEGSISLNSNNAMRGDDKMLVALFDTMRSRGWTTIICIPDISMLNKRIREVHVDFLCKCPVQTVIPGYDTRGFIQIYKHYQREWCGSYDKLICTSVFKPLSPEIQKLYGKIKTEHQNRLIRQFIDRGESDK